MYTRVPPKKPPSNQTQAPRAFDPPIALPKNYSGNAFTEDGRKREFPQNNTVADEMREQEERRKPHISPSAPPSIPSQPQSPLGYSDYPAGEYIRREQEHNGITQPEYTSESDKTNKSQDNYLVQNHAEIIEKKPKSRSGSLFSSLLPDGIFKNNFPFGHGLGSEELLLLGIMLSIYLSGDADGELMMLLCILLFSG